MKIFLKRSTSFLVAVLVFCFSFVPVSAAEIGSTSGSISPLFQAAFDELTSNPTISPDDLLVSSFTDNNGFHFIFSSYSRLLSYSDDILYTGQSNDTIPYESITITETSFGNFGRRWGGRTGLADSGSLSLLSTYDFTYLYDKNVIWSNSRFFAFNFKSFRHVEWNQWGWGDALNYYIGFPFGPVQPDPVVKPSLYGIKLGVEKKGFVDWLKSEGKESVINSPGFSFTSNQLETLVDVYDSYGNNPFAFFSSLSKTFNITTDFKAASSLVQTIQQLYHDYLSYKNSVEIVEIKPSSATHPHWRTDKEDSSLVTDQSDDTRDILILREILRTLIDMPYAVSVRFNYLQTGLTDILIDFQNLIFVVDSLPDDLSNNISVGFDNSINTLVLPLTDINNSINSLVIPLTDINNSIRSLDFSSGGSGILTDDLERLLLIPEDSHVFDDYNLMLQQHFYYNDLDSLPDLEDFIRLEQPVALSSMDDEPLPDIYDSDLYYSAPVVELSNVSFDMDNYKVDFDENEKFAVIDFSDDRWKTPVKFIRGIIGCLVLLWFCNWVVRFCPSLLSGYSSEE